MRKKTAKRRLNQQRAQADYLFALLKTLKKILTVYTATYGKTRMSLNIWLMGKKEPKNKLVPELRHGLSTGLLIQAPLFVFMAETKEGERLGYLGFYEKDLVFYMIKESAWGKGYTSEACTALIYAIIPELAKLNLKLFSEFFKQKALSPTVHPEHVVSQHVLAKLDFTTDGKIEDHGYGLRVTYKLPMDKPINAKQLYRVIHHIQPNKVIQKNTNLYGDCF